MKATYIGNINPNPEYDLYLGTAMPYGTSKYVPPQPKWYEQYGEIADYVISNGVDNYIKLGVNTQNDIIVETKMSYLSLDTQSGFGGIVGTSSTRNVVEGASYTGTVPFYGYTSTGRWTTMDDVPIAIGQELNYRFEFASGDQKVYLNGSLVDTNNQTVNIINPTEMFLFARSFEGALNEPSMGKWWKWKASKPDGTVLADLVPFYVSKKAMTDRDGRVHPVGSYVMIDNVTESVPAIIGQALQGKMKTPAIAAEYGEIAEYLIADGNVYSTTDWTPVFGDDWEITYLTTDTTAVLTGAGARTNSTASDQFIAFPTTAFYIGNGGSSKFGVTVDGSSRAIANKKYTFHANKDGYQINGKDMLYNSSRNNAPCPFMIGSVNNNGVADLRRQKGHYFYLKVLSETGTLKHNYVPFHVTKKAITGQDGRVYQVGSFIWYDLVNNTVPKTIGDWSGVTLVSSITTLNELGVEHTSNIEENIRILNEMGVK